MKILQANKFFFPKGGSEIVLFQEREFLVGAGHHVVDFSMRDARNSESRYAAHFVDQRHYRAGSKLGNVLSALSLAHSPEAARKIRALIQETRPDVIHCHNIYHQLTPSIIGAATAQGVPVVLTLHDYKLVCPTYLRLRNGQVCSECLDGRFFNVVRNRCADGSVARSALLYAEATIQQHLGNYERVDLMIAPSVFMQAAIAHRIPAARMRLLYNGVDTSAIRPSQNDEGYVLYAGRLSPEKGVLTLLDAHAASRKGWPLVVAGTGPLAEELRRRYGRAKFVGHLTGKQLYAALGRAAIVAVPSEWYENCPMSVLEAMACGKPVVASRIGGIPELVADNETGLLFDAGSGAQLRDRIERLLADPELRSAMGLRARARAEQKFSLDKHNAGLLEIYRLVVSPLT